jgi:sialic acid synthase SpsE
MHPVPSIDGAIGLECEANYPSTARWKNRLPGFSDHSGNPWRAVDAIARGCRLIEVHYCIDPRDAGPDLPASLSLEQLRTVCEARDAFASFERG